MRGYGIKAYGIAVLDLLGIGENTMRDKADKIRNALIEGRPWYRIVQYAIEDAHATASKTGVDWKPIAIVKVVHILKVRPEHARAMVSEFSV